MAQQQLCADNCGHRATWKQEYLAFLNANCLEKMERQVARKAVLELRKEWREKNRAAQIHASAIRNAPAKDPGVARGVVQALSRLAYRSEKG